MKTPVLPPTLLFRTAFCVAFARKATGQSVGKIEERVRLNQYEKFSLRPPAAETVREYFKLRRNIAFDPLVKRPKTPPWLFALDREVPGAAYHYFHPLIDLIWGKQESGIFWRNQAQIIPEAWINDEKQKGNTTLANEWHQQNIDTQKRRKRSLNDAPLNHLSFIHLSLLRIPEFGEGALFHKPGLAQGWVRKYASIETELNAISSRFDLDHLAACVGLTMEAAEIGHTDRFTAAKAATTKALQAIDLIPECKRVATPIKALIADFVANLQRRCYTGSSRYGFGWPASWHLKFDGNVAT